MENMQYAEELVREFLVFRGFTNTLQSFENELATDVGRGFQVDKLLDLIFSVYVPKFQAEKLVGLFGFFKQCLSSSSTGTVLLASLSKLELSVMRYYIVYAVRSGRRDKVLEFFGTSGNDLMRKDQDWTPWFAIPYVKSPSTDPHFRLYFSKEWYEALRVAVRNFFDEIFNGTRIPALLSISLEKNTISRLKKEIKQLNSKLAQLQALLEEKEGQLCRSRSHAASATDASIAQSTSSTLSSGVLDEIIVSSRDNQDTYSHATPNPDNRLLAQDLVDAAKAKFDLESLPTPSGHVTTSLNLCSENGAGGSSLMLQDGTIETGRAVEGEEEFPEVKVDFQETFLGHTSPITRCRFSASGNNIASASMDGTVRIWTYDSSTSASRNATIYCGAEIMSLDWECKSDRLLLIGTAYGGIKAWNVDAKRVVCDLNTTEAFPSVLDLKCSPVEPIFVSAAASRHVSGYIDDSAFASLTVWNMKTWKAMTVLPLGEDPPAITSLCFNHNGKILAASATDGMIHMFDMSAGLQITGWPAHDCGIRSILFGADETSIFSLGTDGKVLEWSLQKQGHVLWSINSKSSSHLRHEMALDANGRRLLVTSGSVRAPIYQVRSRESGLRTLPHSASVTTVDWHPTLPIFLTGSADNSVRVTSIL
ncbi:WD repeat-containing protein 91 homolog isoform X2 [Rhodamnia argentea]|uniref:WD repeat-containing protein 91 homolog isoform X2 n=1 Tax=Rhodamnia argentea TaxID=178133 RepID=A0A8B8PLC1_9MYRT|nr:WD repeat-containing protein 91 homolog isoform X2 [Rhodamnia argentea]